MTDVTLVWSNAAGYGDLSVEGADFEADDGVATAVLVSLFTDRRVMADELPPGDTDRRGWWGDGVVGDRDEIGSKLWLLRRRKREPSLPDQAAAYAREALQWMLDDHVATAVAAEGSWGARGELALEVRITLPDESDREFQFQDVLRAA